MKSEFQLAMYFAAKRTHKWLGELPFVFVEIFWKQQRPICDIATDVENWNGRKSRNVWNGVEESFLSDSLFFSTTVSARATLFERFHFFQTFFEIF